jgi:hypothetical protein
MARNKLLFKLPWGRAIVSTIKVYDSKGKAQETTDAFFRGNPVAYANALIAANGGPAGTAGALGQAEATLKSQPASVFWQNVRNYLHNKVFGKAAYAPKSKATPAQN